jgi:hypothetical protein
MNVRHRFRTRGRYTLGVCWACEDIPCESRLKSLITNVDAERTHTRKSRSTFVLDQVAMSRNVRNDGAKFLAANQIELGKDRGKGPRSPHFLLRGTHVTKSTHPLLKAMSHIHRSSTTTHPTTSFPKKKACLLL